MGRVAIVKPEKANTVESMLINMAKSGRIQNKVTEEDLIQLLERIGGSSQNQTKVVVCICYCELYESNVKRTNK